MVIVKEDDHLSGQHLTAASGTAPFCCAIEQDQTALRWMESAWKPRAKSGEQFKASEHVRRVALQTTSGPVHRRLGLAVRPRRWELVDETNSISAAANSPEMRLEDSLPDGHTLKTLRRAAGSSRPEAHSGSYSRFVKPRSRTESMALSIPRISMARPAIQHQIYAFTLSSFEATAHRARPRFCGKR